MGRAPAGAGDALREGGAPTHPICLWGLRLDTVLCVSLALDAVSCRVGCWQRALVCGHPVERYARVLRGALRRSHPVERLGAGTQGSA